MQRNTGNMSKSSYDTDEDGVVDKADGVRVVTDYPESPSLGDVVNGEFTSQAPAQAIRPFTEAIAAMLVAPIMMNQAAPTSMLHEVANDLLLLL